jgi:protein gp37
MELFHHRMNPKWLKWIMEVPLEFPQHTFIFLTKCPQNLPQWSPFPENCWVGVTVTNAKMAEEAGFWLRGVKAPIKFVSFEPLLERIPAHFADYISDDVQGISWVIIGQQTPVSAKTEPKIEWIREIVEAADKAEVKVFLKNNLKPLISQNLGHTFPGFAYGERLRQEMP